MKSLDNKIKNSNKLKLNKGLTCLRYGSVLCIGASNLRLIPAILSMESSGIASNTSQSGGIHGSSCMLPSRTPIKSVSNSFTLKD